MLPSPISTYPPQVLILAGSDSSGGAGVQADIKAVHANGAYAASVITSVTAQNTREIRTVFDLPLRVIEAQVKAIADDFQIDAVKTGMLSSKAIVRRVVLLLATARNLVVDPVMVSKSGTSLLAQDAVSLLKSHLIPLAALVTPNVPEAERLTGLRITSLDDAEAAARKIHQMGCGAVLIKGGHLPSVSERASDLLFDGQEMIRFRGEPLDGAAPHGMGCTLASAIAAHLARGVSLREAVQNAKAYVAGAMRHPLAIGREGGHRPVDHFYALGFPSLTKEGNPFQLTSSPTVVA
jgi:hydroxymethylpyrimidine/phosphomethylpyrimidine kinase